MAVDSSEVLRETEIRPDQIMAGLAEGVASDIRILLDERHNFVSVPCPACGCVEAVPGVFVKCEMSYLRCRRCETVYISPRPWPALLDKFYANSINYKLWNDLIFPASEPARRQKIFRPRAKRIFELCRRYGIEGGTLLEVGAAFGTFCEEVRKLGLFSRVVAVEPTPHLAATCRSRGLEVIEKPIEHINLEDMDIRVVTSFETIEHLFSPAEFLKACQKVLQPGGLLVVTCPNVKGFDIEVLGSLSGSVDYEHLNYFHPASLSHLLIETGFQILESQTPGKLDAELVRKKVLAGEFDLSSQPFLHRILIEEWERVGDAFQKFLADNLLSSHMWLVARKPL